MQIVKNALEKYVVSNQCCKDAGVTLLHRLHNFLFSYRVTPQKTNGSSPYELLFKHAHRARFTLLKPDVNVNVSKQDR